MGPVAAWDLTGSGGTLVHYVPRIRAPAVPGARSLCIQ